MQDVLNAAGVKIGEGGDAALVNEPETGSERLDGSGHAIAARAAQLDEIVWRGKRNQEASIVAQDAPEFGGIHARGDGQDERKRAIGVRHEAIGIGHHPFASGVAPRRRFNGCSRNVDAVRIESGLSGESAEIEAFTAAGIENYVARQWCGYLVDRVEKRAGQTAIVQSPPRRYSSRGIARLFRSPLLRLEQVDVSATRDVERMSTRTEQSPFLARQRHVAMADGAEEHASSVADDKKLKPMPLSSAGLATVGEAGLPAFSGSYIVLHSRPVRKLPGWPPHTKRPFLFGAG
jgi:hypothetical protein